MGSGPLAGVRIVELDGLGALPFATQKLGDMGAEVIRVHRVADVPDDPFPPRYREYDRGRRSVAIDLKHPRGVEALTALVASADAFVESFRPGVCERLGIGPDDLLAVNPRLVYGRLTGWGQEGSRARTAAHSLNYEAVTGAVGSIGPKGGPPVPLLQVLGDFAGGGMHLALGVVCALFEAQRSGRGQVVDAAMTDGVMSIFGVYYGMAGTELHDETALGTNFFDGGSPSYNVYPTSDGHHVTIAPIEDRFYAELLRLLELDPTTLPDRHDPAHWDELIATFTAVFRTRTRAEWEELLGGTDACFAGVYTFSEARDLPVHSERGVFRDTPDGDRELTPVPRLSRTPGEPGPSYAHAGADTDDVLGALGLDVAALRRAGAVG